MGLDVGAWIKEAAEQQAAAPESVWKSHHSRLLELIPGIHLIMWTPQKVMSNSWSPPSCLRKLARRSLKRRERSLRCLCSWARTGLSKLVACVKSKGHRFDWRVGGEYTSRGGVNIKGVAFVFIFVLISISYAGLQLCSCLCFGSIQDLFYTATGLA